MGNHCRQMLSQFFRLLFCSDSGAHRIGEKEDKIPKFCSTVTGDMDRISGLSDDLLIKILSFLPTEVAVSTSILSKRWECLWRWLPKLDFHNISDSKDFLLSFLNRNLPLHRAPVIESFRFELGYPGFFKPEDVQLWIMIAVSRYLRELEISSCSYPNILPSSLYICKSLVILKLGGGILLDVPPMACLPSLKTLQLDENKYLDGESLGRLLSICPVLEDLSVNFSTVVESETDMITVAVPSLQRLSLYLDYYCSIDGLVIDTPSLKYFKLVDDNRCITSPVIENMPKLEEAYVDVTFPDINHLIRSIISVKSLTICSEDVYGDGFVFNQLKHLRLCLFKEISSNLLVRLLNDSPNLRELQLYVDKNHGLAGGLDSWNEPSTVPECMMSSLQTFNWSEYRGRPQERDLVVYILKNARRLETATISSNDFDVIELEMIKELSLSSRASTTCQLYI